MKDKWDKISSLASLLTPLMVVFVGYFLNDSVNAAFKDRQLHLDNIKEIHELLIIIPKIPKEKYHDLKATNLAIAAFGPPAIPLLINEMNSRKGKRPDAAKLALQTFVVTDPAPVCGALIRVINNRTKVFYWDAHRMAIELIGDLDCRSKNARQAIKQYGKLLNFYDSHLDKCGPSSNEDSSNEADSKKGERCANYYPNVVSAETFKKTNFEKLDKSLKRTDMLINTKNNR